MVEDAPWRLRGVRGATTVADNSRDAILEATGELLRELVVRNAIDPANVASAWFTTTPDLDAEFPAVAARAEPGWDVVALICGHEMNVPGSLERCLRILLHVNTPRRQSEMQHVYLRGARVLRPEWAREAEPPAAERAAVEPAE